MERQIKLQYFVVTHINKKVVGFGAIENMHLIDLLYVHKDCLGSGVGSKIFESLVSMAQSREINILKAEVSKTARQFFEAKGFVIVQEQSKRVDGIVLSNYEMLKTFD